MKCFSNRLLTTKWTGVLRALSLQSRTKVNVDPAGHFPPPEVLKVLGKLQDTISCLLVSSNSWIAVLKKVIIPVKVASWILVSSTSSTIRESIQNRISPRSVKSDKEIGGC